MAAFYIIINRKLCKGCELCVSVCPKSVLSMSAEIQTNGVPVAEVTKPEACIGCRQCAEICPDAAIEIEKEV